jgi:hypothetical protein
MCGLAKIYNLGSKNHFQEPNRSASSHKEQTPPHRCTFSTSRPAKRFVQISRDGTSRILKRLRTTSVVQVPHSCIQSTFTFWESSLYRIQRPSASTAMFSADGTICSPGSNRQQLPCHLPDKRFSYIVTAPPYPQNYYTSSSARSYASAIPSLNVVCLLNPTLPVS